AKLTGAAMTDGKLWAGGAQPALWVFRDNHAGIGSGKAPPDCWQMVSGHPLLVADGKPAPSENKAVHPRTAVGVDTTGTKLVLLVVDGRHPEVATGMTYAELAQELLRLGCTTALNLDGGGSTTLVMRDAASGQLRVINTPSDHRERPVANVLGIRCRTPSAQR
ncbi:MAG: phosphodiester glycosidase family protein, partial [Kiritimatiellaeota bacterium]|nr:phosphodiester glycosidase family protein [Kiritimatiellota bacterium]